ncbi:hypothetical protein N9H19_02425 [Flavobacteriales bacterium]|nr:hypothetical protein [Flavobacteriales bacterium]
MQIGLIISLLIIFFQDLKDRSVSLIIFPVLFIIVSYLSIMESDVSTWLIQTGINSVFLLFQLAVIKLYFKRKYDCNTAFFDYYIGWGDIIFLFVLGSAFNFIQLLLFMLYSMALALAIYFPLIYLKKTQTIPLAGFMSLCWILVLSANYLGFNLLKFWL